MARLLIVDDDRDVLTVLRAGLQARGHEAIAFSDPVEARTWLRASAPDGVLLDVRMPVVSGWDLLEEIRKSKRTGSLPVVMLSANGDVGERIRGLRLGADDFCVKPFHVEEIVARVEGLLARRNPSLSSIQGDLATFPLADVLQSIEQKKLTGTLDISSGDAAATASYRRGRCVEAAFGALPGREALLELLSLGSGTFRFIEEPGSGLDETLGEQAGPWLPRASELLLENAWLEDELERRRELLPQDDSPIELGEAPIVPSEHAGLPALPFAAIASALAVGAPIEMRTLEKALRCSSVRAALAISVLLAAGALRVATAAPAVPASSEVSSSEAAPAETSPEAAHLLERLHAGVPGFLAGALVEARSHRPLAALSVHRDFDPALAAKRDCETALPDSTARTGSVVEEVVFVLDDQLHLLLTTADGNLLFVAADRSSSANPAQLRNAVTRALRAKKAPGLLTET